MNRLLSVRMALNIMMVIFSLILVFHLLVLTGIIPYGIVWGGRLKNEEQMMRFEMVSLVVNSVMLFLVLVKARVLKLSLPYWLFLIAFWAMAVLFLLNTVGNLLSTNVFEKAFFTPLTLLLFICSLRLALSKNESALQIAATTPKQ